MTVVLAFIQPYWRRAAYVSRVSTNDDAIEPGLASGGGGWYCIRDGGKWKAEIMVWDGPSRRHSKAWGYSPSSTMEGSLIDIVGELYRRWLLLKPSSYFDFLCVS